MKNSVSFILLATILLESCVFYQKTAVSLKEAQDMGKVKVITTHGAVYIFKTIVLRDSLYFGVNENNQQVLYEGEISSIYPQNMKKSILVTRYAVMLPLALLGFTLLIAFIQVTS